MTNAKVEIIGHVNGKDVELIRIVFGKSYGLKQQLFINGSLNEVLERLDFEYDNGYGGQELFGYIWYKDGTWSHRGEYDGSEWWEYMVRPDLDIAIN
tara:strand:- start:2633 stop:2923 length:291 start_codon:yes stop_codon:yes gene_type:complete